MKLCSAIGKQNEISNNRQMFEISPTSLIITLFVLSFDHYNTSEKSAYIFNLIVNTDKIST